ncbi:nitric oxide-associated protein 1 [Acanthopagrus latus]|uniref:nitric oxide-associated protein 1 n=1 Tax=Acanthopagrus latus TaxID=8177 RepID=UPI00187BDFCC|nr:nitric oxide-associated protein 1 [Acanthopagrus latus]XP_036932733.1 nitric oxide-associated protein 1 [Acanthopagrus latus]
MLRVFQVSVRRALRSGVGFPVRRVATAGRTGPVLGSEAAAGRCLTLQLCSRVRSCTVDPNLEEEFVFVDCTDPEEDHHQEEDFSSSAASPGLQVSPPPGPAADPPQRQLKSLERQLQVLRGVAQQEVEPEYLIQFHDVDFPLDESIVAAKKKKKKKAGKSGHQVFGTPDMDEPVSDTCCAGCGAVLHCTAVDVPGYLPSEKFRVLQQEERLGGATCQRCHLLTHHHKALNLQVSSDQYRAVVQQLRPLRALVLLIVDLMDIPDSIVPDLPALIGTNKHIVVLGNKIDLLPGDAPNYLQRIKRQLSQYCHNAGFGHQVTDIHLISAKTGYGIEGLISSLQRSWKYKGDVYLVGSANAGKSSLFNTLLESDYCKSKASDLIHKATISPWPGTTLNLLKFPIINPTPYRMFRRQERLKKAERQTESELQQDELHRLKRFSKQGYLVGRVGRTFWPRITSGPDEIEFDPDILAFGENEDGHMMTKARSRLSEEFTYNELKDAHWLFDTPGIMKENDILNLMTEQEVMSVVPSQAVIPRTFVLKPGTTLFVGALARIDYLQGEKSCFFSVVASNRLPVHLTSLEKADSVYEKHAGHVLLGVPAGGSERMKDFPALVPQEFRLEGRGHLEAAADIKLSSAGWVAVTAGEGEQLVFRVHGPVAAAFSVRMPPLLPHVVSLKGERIRKSAAYKTVKPAGLLEAGLSARGAERLQVKRKKK